MKILLNKVPVFLRLRSPSPEVPARTVAELSPSETGVVSVIGGERSFRRRLMELGLVPGTSVTLHKVAPLGDPLELEIRGCRLSIRRREAAAVILSA